MARASAYPHLSAWLRSPPPAAAAGARVCVSYLHRPRVQTHGGGARASSAHRQRQRLSSHDKGCPHRGASAASSSASVRAEEVERGRELKVTRDEDDDGSLSLDGGCQLSNSQPTSDSEDDEDDESAGRLRKTALWERWWFEARNAPALELLARMPGANLNAKTKARYDYKGDTSTKATWIQGGHTAATLAAQRDDPQSIVMLADMGADLDARDDNDATALHHAAHADAARATEALLDAGADPNMQDSRDGSTAAILAAYGSRRKTLGVLIARHPAVDLTLRDAGHATVAGHAAQRGLHGHVLDILRLCGPGGAGRLARGQKSYLAGRRELNEQLQGLSAEMLVELAQSWRARPAPGDDKKTLIVKLLQQTP